MQHEVHTMKHARNHVFPTPCFMFPAKGFTVIEVLVAIALAGIIAAIGVASFVNWNTTEALDTETGKIISLLLEARSLTISGSDSSAFGVHFESGKAVLFRGSTYTPESPSNRTQALHDEVRISSIALTGGASDVVFKKLTGATAQSGTVTLVSARDAQKTRTITITLTGVAY